MCCKPADRGQGGMIYLQVAVLYEIFIGQSWKAGASGRHVLLWLTEMRVSVEECVYAN